MKRAHVLAVTFLAGLIVGCAVPAHAETFDCEGIQVTYLPAQIPVNGQPFRAETLIVGGMPASDIHTASDFQMTESDSFQVIGTINGSFSNFTNYPRMDKYTLVVGGAQPVQYTCEAK